MRFAKRIVSVLFFLFYMASSQAQILPGAYSTEKYVPRLKGKKVGVVANHTSLVGKTHLVDTLLRLGVDVKKIFCPEHGFRGMASAGAVVKSGTDEKTGLPVVSLYGKHKKPSSADLNDIDVMLFDLQDVGVRFYTYISTLQLVAEACADNGIPLIVLDRPNPNGFYVDGPVLDTSRYRSFIGMQPVPVVYGMTIGEYILMLKGEKWLNTNKEPEIKVVKCKNYTHHSFYELPVPPSPNLKDMKAVYLYPSLCFLEGTVVSVGRGTKKPFRIFGAPFFPDTLPYSFVPVSMPGAKRPKFENEKCYGFDVTSQAENIKKEKHLNLSWLIEAYMLTPQERRNKFFRSSFDKLAGNDIIRKEIEKGSSAKTIRKTWEKQLNDFKRIRKKYLLYPE